MAEVNLPPIPEKRYFTIGEVAKLCEVKPHVLRYWEQEFQVLSPSKRRGNRRYYQHKDVLMVRKIRSLLYEQGFTIGGARQQLLQQTDKDSTPVPAVMAATAAALEPDVKSALQKTVLELEMLLTEMAD